MAKVANATKNGEAMKVKYDTAPKFAAFRNVVNCGPNKNGPFRS